jgi:hypothetical protein
MGWNFLFSAPAGVRRKQHAVVGAQSSFIASATKQAKGPPPTLRTENYLTKLTDAHYRN